MSCPPFPRSVLGWLWCVSILCGLPCYYETRLNTSVRRLVAQVSQVSHPLFAGLTQPSQSSAGCGQPDLRAPKMRRKNLKTRLGKLALGSGSGIMCQSSSIASGGVTTPAFFFGGLEGFFDVDDESTCQSTTWATAETLQTKRALGRLLAGTEACHRKKSQHTQDPTPPNLKLRNLAPEARVLPVHDLTVGLLGRK